MAEDEKEPRYKDIEVPKFDGNDLPTSFLDAMSPAQQDLVKKVSKLERGLEFQMRSIPVRNWMIKDMDSRLQTLETTNQKLRPFLAIVVIAIPVIITAIVTILVNKFF